MAIGIQKKVVRKLRMSTLTAREVLRPVATIRANQTVMPATANKRPTPRLLTYVKCLSGLLQRSFHQRQATLGLFLEHLFPLANFSLRGVKLIRNR